MKKILVLMLAMVLTLALGACGDTNTLSSTNLNDTSSGTLKSAASISSSEPESILSSQEEVEIPGTYMSVGMIPGDTYDLNENGSYDCGEEKGTYTADDEGSSIAIQPKEGQPRTLIACGAYYHTETKMTEDTEYGLSPTFDENGRSNQTFTLEIPNTEAEEKKYHDQFATQLNTSDHHSKTITLELHEDGSYIFSYSKPSTVNEHLTDTITYEGSYTLEGNVLNLDWNSNTYPMLFTDSAIYPAIYAKKTDANGTEIEAAQAAIQAAEEAAAQNRWWTIADEATAAEITKALVGTWEYSDEYSTHRLTFTESDVLVDESFFGKTAVYNSGPFTVLKGAILIQYETSSNYGTIINTVAAPYVYADGSLTLYETRDILNDEILLDPAADFPAVSSYQYQKNS